MTSKNDITGDSIITKPGTDAYADGWERIFGKKEKKTLYEEYIEICRELESDTPSTDDHGIYSEPK